MSKFLRTALVILALQPLPALAQTETQYGFPVSDTPPGDLPCYMVTSNRNTLNLGRLCGTVPASTSNTAQPINFRGSSGINRPNVRSNLTGNSNYDGSNASSGRCDYPWQRDSLGRLCGDRAASERPGGSLGGSSSNSDRRRSLSLDNQDWKLFGED